jgi:TPR repeat protein
MRDLANQPASGPVTRDMIRSGLRLLHRGQSTAARGWFARAEQTDDPVLLSVLGTVYDHSMNEVGFAESCYRRAVQNGSTTAMNNLGVLLTHQDRFDEAMHWLQRAATAGDVDALHNLGSVLEHHGYRDEALAYFHQAADAGQPNAIARMGVHQFLRTQHQETQRRQRRRCADTANATDTPRGWRQLWLAALLTPHMTLLATVRSRTLRLRRR